MAQRDAPLQWRLFNLKLAHSRRLLYTGLLFLLAESSRVDGNRETWLRQHLRLTPLERIAWVMAAHTAANIQSIAHCYDRFLSCLQDPAYRAALQDIGGTETNSPHPLSAHGVVTDGMLEDNDAYRHLIANSQLLTTAMLDFLWSRRGVWLDETLSTLLL